MLYPEATCHGPGLSRSHNADLCRYVRAKVRMIFKMFVLCEMVFICLFSEGALWCKISRKVFVVYVD